MQKRYKPRICGSVNFFCSAWYIRYISMNEQPKKKSILLWIFTSLFQSLQIYSYKVSKKLRAKCELSKSLYNEWCKHYSINWKICHHASNTAENYSQIKEVLKSSRNGYYQNNSMQKLFITTSNQSSIDFVSCIINTIRLLKEKTRKNSKDVNMCTCICIYMYQHETRKESKLLLKYHWYKTMLNVRKKKRKY